MIKKCKKCNLHKTRQNTVFGDKFGRRKIMDYNQKINWEERKNRLLEISKKNKFSLFRL